MAFIGIGLTGGRCAYVRVDKVVEVIERMAYGTPGKPIGSYVHMEGGRELECIDSVEEILDLLGQAMRHVQGGFSSDVDAEEDG